MSIKDRVTKKVAIAMLMISLVAVAIVYPLTQTRSGFAILTTPPPGIPGPYYVTAEAKIYGPVVDLAAIKSDTGGTYASDYTYVQWGTNPFYRVYSDNTLQEVYCGQMTDVLAQLGLGFRVENDIKTTFDNLKNLGGLDTSSLLGEIGYFGNMPGSFICLYNTQGSFMVTTSRLYAASVTVAGNWWGQWINLYMNDSLLLQILPAYGGTIINSAGDPAGSYSWKVEGLWTCDYGVGWWGWISATLYFQDVLSTNVTMIQNSRVYAIVDSPGTGFVSKSTLPSSPVIGSTVNILDEFDPPAANNVNLTDLYPNAFTWTGTQMTLEKFKVGVGLVASASLSVTPVPAGSNMKISITYDQALNILQSLSSDEYIHVSYTLTAPSASGEYTLPSATMAYSIPLPQT